MILIFFVFTFPKKWVSRAMGNETFYGDGLIQSFIFLVKTMRFKGLTSFNEISVRYASLALHTLSRLDFTSSRGISCMSVAL